MIYPPSGSGTNPGVIQVSICRVLCERGLQIAQSGYYAFKGRPASLRAVRDGELGERIEQLSGTGRWAAGSAVPVAPWNG